MKLRLLCLLLSVLLLSGYTLAEQDSTGFDGIEVAEEFVILVEASEPMSALYAKNADVRCYPASTTKILTCIICLETGNLEDWVKVSDRAVKLGKSSSRMGLVAGESFRLMDLLYGLMLPSGNDAAIALGEHIGGSVEGFADMMNAKAQEIGMASSHFVNPHGLHDAEHYTTARDMAILTAYALENELFCEIVKTPSYTCESQDGRSVRLKQSNRLLRDRSAADYTPISCLYPYCIGVKTGETGASGKCLVAAAKQNDTTYIAVLLGGPSAPSQSTSMEQDAYSARRFLDACTLFDHAFRYDLVTVSVEDLLDHCLITSFVKQCSLPQDRTGSILYRIRWDGTDTVRLPRYLVSPLLSDIVTSNNIFIEVLPHGMAVGESVGTASVVCYGEVLFSAEIVIEDIDGLTAPTAPPTEATSSVPTPSEEPTAHPVRSSISFFSCGCIP